MPTWYYEVCAHNNAERDLSNKRHIETIRQLVAHRGWTETNLPVGANHIISGHFDKLPVSFDLKVANIRTPTLQYAFIRKHMQNPNSPMWSVLVQLPSFDYPELGSVDKAFFNDAWGLMPTTDQSLYSTEQALKSIYMNLYSIGEFVTDVQYKALLKHRMAIKKHITIKFYQRDHLELKEWKCIAHGKSIDYMRQQSAWFGEAVAVAKTLGLSSLFQGGKISQEWVDRRNRELDKVSTATDVDAAQSLATLVNKHKDGKNSRTVIKLVAKEFALDISEKKVDVTRPNKSRAKRLACIEIVPPTNHVKWLIDHWLCKCPHCDGRVQSVHFDTHVSACIDQAFEYKEFNLVEAATAWDSDHMPDRTYVSKGTKCERINMRNLDTLLTSIPATSNKLHSHRRFLQRMKETLVAHAEHHDNRKTNCLPELSAYYGCNKSAAKRLPLMILNGGSPDTQCDCDDCKAALANDEKKPHGSWLETWCSNEGRERVQTNGHHRLIRGMRKERTTIRDCMQREFPKIFEYVHDIKTRFREDERHPTILSAVSWCLGTIENQILMAMHDFFEHRQWPVRVLVFDGLMPEPPPSTPLKDDGTLVDTRILRDCEAAVTSETKWVIDLANKPLPMWSAEGTVGAGS